MLFSAAGQSRRDPDKILLRDPGLDELLGMPLAGGRHRGTPARIAAQYDRIPIRLCAIHQRLAHHSAICGLIHV